MRYWTAASELPSAGGGARLLVALSVLSLVCALLTAARREDGCGLPDRRISDLTPPSPENLPHWWVPMFSPIKAGPVDSFLCGFALRLGAGAYVLANLNAVSRIRTLQKQSKKNLGWFMFKPNTTIDLDKPIRRDRPYVPQYRSTYVHNIAIYEINVTPFNASVKPVYQKYPHKLTGVSMQSDKKAESKNCFMMTYAYEDGLSEPWPSAKGKVKFVNVALSKEQGCNNSLCFMVTANEGTGFGNLCGRFANLGNPVICGQSPNLKVTYLVHATGWQDDHIEKCTNLFRAVKVADICEHEHLRSVYGYMACL